MTEAVEAKALRVEAEAIQNLLLQHPCFLVCFKSFEVNRQQSLKVAKSDLK